MALVRPTRAPITLGDPATLNPFTTLGDAARRVLKGLLKPGGDPHDRQADTSPRVRGDEPGAPHGSGQEGRRGDPGPQAVLCAGPDLGCRSWAEGRDRVQGRRSAAVGSLIMARSWAWYAIEVAKIAALVACGWLLLVHIIPGAS